jgi:hypothetical protein
VSAPLGAAAEVADVLLDRYRQALAELPRELSERQVSVR